ncbi:MAG: hypothetical protein H0T08_05970 [Acidobacteria bacterium]|nr:hypothetical protein [Acidobacteriota bacterium]
MKIKILLSLAVFIFAAQISLAQDAQLSAREQFEAWKQEKIVAAGKADSLFSTLSQPLKKPNPKLHLSILESPVLEINLTLRSYRSRWNNLLTANGFGLNCQKLEVYI